MKKSGIKLPEAVKRIIELLNINRHRADIVGGCTRDYLLGKIPSDYDITTDATPDELREIFAEYKTVDTGIRHGTLTVIVGGEPYEVTTYRLDGSYNDHRHPDSVSFTRLLSEDLARRDFTMNAICYNENDGFTDLYGGTRDIEEGIIRTVGEPERRFDEDALRILRGVRFCATLDFAIEEGTAIAIREKASLLSQVSAERIAVEWRKLLSGPAALRVISEYPEVIAAVMPELKFPPFPDKAAFYSENAEYRELLLFYLSHGKRASEVYDVAAQRLRYDNKSRKFGVAVLENVDFCDTHTDIGLKTLLMRIGAEYAEGVMRVRRMLSLCTDAEFSRLKHLEEMSVWRLSELAVGGDDIISLGACGTEVGRILNALLLLVVREECANEKNQLLKAAEELRGYKDGV